MREVVVIGVGMTKFGKWLDKSIRELGAEATCDAIKDAGINAKDVEVAYCGNAVSGLITGQAMVLGQIILREVGIVGIPITNVENACASGSSAFRDAWMAVGSGLYDVALAVGVEKLYADDTAKTMTALASASDVELEGKLGIVMPGVWAMRARKHMEKYGTTLEQLAMVSVKNHKNGCLNRRSQYRKEFTVEEVLNSRMITDPLTLLQCSPIGDGAAAAILCARDKVSKYSTNKMITVAACVLKSGNYERLRDITFNELERKAAQEAFQVSGCGPGDIDFAEVHDCFTIAEIMRLESLGLFPEGEVGLLQERGVFDIGGEFPVNASGGLLAKGHPVGATGVAQIAELTWQLRGEASPRQIEGARVGLAHCSGGAVGDDTAACTVTILKR